MALDAQLPKQSKQSKAKSKVKQRKGIKEAIIKDILRDKSRINEKKHWQRNEQNKTNFDWQIPYA